MTQVRQAPAEDEAVVLNGTFFRKQAKEAIGTFFLPLLGVYAAATGARFAFRYRPHRR